MNKEQAKERLCAIETEVEKLRRIIDEPEPRKPEAGDVWKHRQTGEYYVVLEEKQGFFTDLLTATPYEDEGIQRNFTYLGKFDEVFVKASGIRAAIREALSIKDESGDTLEECTEPGNYFDSSGCKALYEKLKSIIK